MVHFYESSIITTVDGLNCQVYSNEHPPGYIIVKPKYIPVDKIFSDSLPCRYISGKRMLRLDMWSDKEKLKKYIEDFKKAYPEYICHECSKNHECSERLFFSVPLNKIHKIYDPKHGLSELMSMPEDSLDDHLRIVVDFVKLLLGSKVPLDKLGVTYSTLVGHYFMKYSDINIVVYGKKNFWKTIDFLKEAKHQKLRWKTKEEWLEFRKKRERSKIFSEKEFLFQMERKHTEGFFDNLLFLIFGVEEPDETWFKWEDEKYQSYGSVKIKAKVTDNYSSIVRPGCYDITNAKIIEHLPDKKRDIDADKDFDEKKIKKIVSYSRDYALQAFPGETVEASGVLERVLNKDGSSYYRIVIGYFDSYISERRGKEYIKVI